MQVTHEPCFCLLREVVSYSGGGRGQPIREALENPGKEHFILFHIGCVSASPVVPSHLMHLTLS